MPDHDSTDYVWGQTSAELRALQNDLAKLEQQTDKRFQEVARDLDLLKRICYALAGAVAFVQLVGPLLQLVEGRG